MRNCLLLMFHAYRDISWAVKECIAPVPRAQVQCCLDDERYFLYIWNDLPYTWKFSPGENFANFACGQKFFLQIFSHGAAHCASTGPPTTSWRVARPLSEIKFGGIFVTIQIWAIGEIFSQRKFPCIHYYIMWAERGNLEQKIISYHKLTRAL